MALKTRTRSNYTSRRKQMTRTEKAKVGGRDVRGESNRKNWHIHKKSQNWAACSTFWISALRKYAFIFHRAFEFECENHCEASPKTGLNFETLNYGLLALKITLINPIRSHKVCPKKHFDRPTLTFIFHTNHF